MERRPATVLMQCEVYANAGESCNFAPFSWTSKPIVRPSYQGGRPTDPQRCVRPTGQPPAPAIHRGRSEGGHGHSSNRSRPTGRAWEAGHLAGRSARFHCRRGRWPTVGRLIRRQEYPLSADNCPGTDRQRTASRTGRIGPLVPMGASCNGPKRTTSCTPAPSCRTRLPSPFVTHGSG
jgi:hypothetical protein